MVSTRDRILGEASRQLSEQGYAQFTVAAVRDALGLSSGSMFHAFPSKAALAAAVYVEGMAAYQRTAIAAITAGRDPEAAIRAWIGNHMTWIEDHPGLARYLFSALPEDVMTEAIGPLSQYNKALYKVIADLVECATCVGLMGRLERGLAQAICIGPAHEYGKQWTRDPSKTPPRALIQTLQDAAIAALAATVPAPRTRRRRKPR